jgi:hypothetical protein
MSIVVIGIDPGDSMGVAALKDGELIAAFQGPPGDGIIMLELLLDRYPTDDNSITVACERFTPASRIVSHQPVAQQVIGVVESVCHKYGVSYYSQGPADAHAIATNELLKRLGLYRTKNDVGQSDANDINMAIKHALLVLAKLHATVFDQMIKNANTT